MWLLYIYGRQTRKKYYSRDFDEHVAKDALVRISQSLFLEFKTFTPWAEDLDLFVCHDNNLGCVRSFNHLFRWQVANKVGSQYDIVNE